jgi:hypothetical protein
MMQPTFGIHYIARATRARCGAMLQVDGFPPGGSCPCGSRLKRALNRRGREDTLDAQRKRLQKDDPNSPQTPQRAADPRHRPARERQDPRPRDPPDRRRTAKTSVSCTPPKPWTWPRGRPRPGRDLAQRRSAGLQDHGFRQVQVRDPEARERGAQEAEDDRGQGGEVPSQHGHPRLRRQDAQRDPVPRSRRQGEGDAALPGPRDGAPEPRARIAGAGGRRCRGPRQGREHAQDGRPPDGHDDRPREGGPWPERDHGAHCGPPCRFDCLVRGSSSRTSAAGSVRSKRYPVL